MKVITKKDYVSSDRPEEESLLKAGYRAKDLEPFDKVFAYFSDGTIMGSLPLGENFGYNDLEIKWVCGVGNCVHIRVKAVN